MQNSIVPFMGAFIVFALQLKEVILVWHVRKIAKRDC